MKSRACNTRCRNADFTPYRPALSGPGQAATLRPTLPCREQSLLSTFRATAIEGGDIASHAVKTPAGIPDRNTVSNQIPPETPGKPLSMPIRYANSAETYAQRGCNIKWITDF